MNLIEKIGLKALHQVDPETAHGLSIKALKMGLVPTPGPVTSSRLKTTVAGMELPNPVGLAAGFDKNAEVLAKAAAAHLIDEKDLSSFLLVETVLKLLYKKEKLEQMAHQTKNLAKPDATETIVDQIFQMIDKN